MMYIFVIQGDNTHMEPPMLQELFLSKYSPKISNENIKIIQQAYDEIFKSENFRSNIDNLNSDIKKNEFVNKIINFLNSDKKRPISLPEKSK